MLEHGGRLREAAAHYQIPLENWLDLSTGINPEAWPVPALSLDCWQRLPEADDGLEAAADAGATAIIQPGGAMKDADVIAAGDARGLAMVFTGVRHFRH